MSPAAKEPKRERLYGSSETDLYRLTEGTAPSGGVPIPFNVLAEESVLGSLIIDRDAIVKVADWLEPADFFRETHGILYAAILACYRAHRPPDLVVLSDYLAGRGELESVGGLSRLAALMHIVPSVVHLEYYARIVKRDSLKRALISVGGRIAGLGYTEGDVEVSGLLDAAQSLLGPIQRASQSGSPWHSLSSAWEETLADLSELQAGGVGRGIPSGFAQLDQVTGLWQGGDFIILAALTSRGKTAFGLNLAKAAAEAGYLAVIVSLESSRHALAKRFLAMISGTDLRSIRSANLSDTEWRNLITVQAEYEEIASRIFFRDATEQNIRGIETSLESLMAREGRKPLVILDYIQLLGSDGTRDEGRAQEVARTSRAIKVMATRLDVPVVGLSQFSRAAIGTGEEPGLHHLRESGALEQDAGIVLMLHRPDKDRPMLVHLLIAKNREGEAGVRIQLLWDGGLQRFVEIQSGDGIQPY